MAYIIRSYTSPQGLGIERRAAGQQLIQQHAQRIDIAARIDIQPAEHRLFRAHVGRRADRETRFGEALRLRGAHGPRNAEVRSYNFV